MGGGKGHSGSLRSRNPAFCGHVEAKKQNRAPISILSKVGPIGDTGSRAVHRGQFGHLGRRDQRRGRWQGRETPVSGRTSSPSFLVTHSPWS
jgi:hypothetical protein